MINVSIKLLPVYSYHKKPEKATGYPCYFFSYFSLIFFLEFLNDEEVVIIALIDVLPKLPPLLGGPEHAYLVIESLELLFFVPTGMIKRKVKDALTSIYGQYQQHLTSFIFGIVIKLWIADEATLREWDTDEVTTKRRALFLVDLIKEELSTEQMGEIRDICLHNFLYEENAVKIAIIDQLNHLKFMPLFEEVKILPKISLDFKNLMKSYNFLEKLQKLLVKVLEYGSENLNNQVNRIFSQMKTREPREDEDEEEVELENFEKEYHKAKILIESQANLGVAEVEAARREGLLKEILEDQGERIGPIHEELFGCVLKHIERGLISREVRESLPEMIERSDGYKIRFLENFWSLVELVESNEEEFNQSRGEGDEENNTKSDGSEVASDHENDFFGNILDEVQEEVRIEMNNQDNERLKDFLIAQSDQIFTFEGGKDTSRFEGVMIDFVKGYRRCEFLPELRSVVERVLKLAQNFKTFKNREKLIKVCEEGIDEHAELRAMFFKFIQEVVFDKASIVR